MSMKKIVIPSNIKGLIFDCDGTIADTMPIHYQAYMNALGENGRFFTQEMFYDLAGVPAVPVMEILKGKYSLEIDPQQIADEKEREFQNLLHEVDSIEAVENVIKEYHGKLPMIVASGGTRENIERTLKLVELDKYFDHILSADEVPNGKPAPDIFLTAAHRIGIEPKDCLVFEDADMGIRAAEAAGMQWVDVRKTSED